MRAALVLVFAACQSHTALDDARVVEVTELPVTPAPRAPHDAAPPWSLTASDGSGLQITRVVARAAIEGPLAFTELHLDFHNAEARTREGTFAISLPPGAAVSRFAMEQEGAWQEAEVVDKTLARLAYDDALHARKDPALLEKGAGNQFTAKVFPIPANADKHLVIAYSQELDTRGYALTLRGLPKLERIDASLLAGGQEQTLGESNWTPDRDFVADFGRTPAAVGAGTDVVASVEVGGAVVADPPDELTLLVDTSASRAVGYAAYVHAIRDLVAALAVRYGEGLPLEVIAFDQDTQAIFRGEARGYDDRALYARGALGASDLGDALAKVPPGRRVVIVTDGMITAGPAPSAERRARIDVVLAGAQRDEAAARALTHGGGEVFDLERGAAAIAVELGERVPADVAIEISGAIWSYPRALRSARPGTRVMVHARLARPATAIDVQIGDAHHALGLASGTAALVGRAVAAAEIEELEHALAAATGDAREAIRGRLSRRSVAARVVSSQTAMLVLESDADYARYHIDRDALADILVVGPEGIAQQHRTTLAIAKRPEPPVDAPQLARQQAIEQARSAGILGAAITTTTTLDLATLEDVSSGFDTSNVYGGLLADAPPSSTGGIAVRLALTGRYAEVAANPDRALELARAWHAEAPDDVLALIALGEASEARGDRATAARAYGSIIDLFPTRAELRRFAGERLEHLALWLAIDTYRRAFADRPEHLDGARLLAYALVRDRDYAGAFATILAGIDQPHASGRFLAVDRVLGDDAGMIGAAYLAHGGDEQAILAALGDRHLGLATQPSTRFILYWETDANDVDLHVRDAKGGHAWYASQRLPSGGTLYGDVTTGFGPECFAIEGAPTAGPYHLSVNYFSRGAMGFGMGLVQIQRFDGRDFALENRPYVIMNDRGDVDLGRYDQPTQ